MTSLKTLKIDDKWSVEYDPASNTPERVLRYGEDISHATSPQWDWTNDVRAMFHALLAARERIAELERALAPLAKVADVYDKHPMEDFRRNHTDDTPVYAWFPAYCDSVAVTVGDARNAARILKGTEDG